MTENKDFSMLKSVMTKPVITINATNTVREAAEVMSKKAIGSIVVMEEDNPVGIATERDILQRVVAKGLDPSKITMKEIMSYPLITVQEETSILKAVKLMERKKIRRLIVMKGEKMVGIVTQRDLLRVLALHVVISFRPLL